MSEPWNHDQHKKSSKQPRPRLREYLGHLVEVVVFSALVYTAVLKHYYVNRKKN